jgi:tetratricopeptide (TPR) repeat protein
MSTAASTIESPKRRQAIQVALFLTAVTALTVGLFFALKGEVVAFRRGENALNRGDFAGARPLLETAWAGGHRTPRARLDLARVRLETGDRMAALPLYLEALEAAPRDPILIDTVAGLHQAAGQPEQALAVHQRLGPPEALALPALVRRADILQQTGDLAGAVPVYRVAVTREPREAALRLRLGMLLAWTGQRSAAVAELRAALALDPGLRQARLQLARVLLWDGQFAESVTEFRRVLPP